MLALISKYKDHSAHLNHVLQSCFCLLPTNCMHAQNELFGLPEYMQGQSNGSIGKGSHLINSLKNGKGQGDTYNL